jgi:parallel beta-helix repeat protein
MRKLSTVSVAALGWTLALLSPTARAATYYVPDDYATIQAALTAAAGWDTILVRDGTYTGAQNKELDFAGKAVTLRSENGPANCIIDCQNSGRAFFFDDGEGPWSVVDGFTITNGNSAAGGGIACDQSSPTIMNNTIEDNTASSGGGGIILWESASPTIVGNIIRRNSALGDPSGGQGGGIYSYNASSTISSNTIIDNTALVCGGGVAVYGHGSVDDNVVSGNQAAHGGGVFLYNPSEPTGPMRGNIICGNSAELGGGVYFDPQGATVVAHNVIAGNAATSKGGGIATFNGAPAVTNNTIAANSAPTGGGICCVKGTPATVKNCILWGNGDDLADSSATYSDIEDGDAGTGNMSADPLFEGGPSGAWTATATYSTGTGQSTLTDSSASWTPDAYAGLLLNPDTSQVRQCVIVGNTATTIIVWGDVTSFVTSGESYQVWDYHEKSCTGHWTGSGWVIDSQHSLCIDAGDPADPYNNEPTPNGARINMGAYGNTNQASKAAPLAVRWPR